jgi:hypothetical protein
MECHMCDGDWFEWEEFKISVFSDVPGHPECSWKSTGAWTDAKTEGIKDAEGNVIVTAAEVLGNSTAFAFSQPCSDPDGGCHHMSCEATFQSCMAADASNTRAYCNNQTIGFYATDEDERLRQNRIGGLNQCRGCESYVRCDWRCDQVACENFGEPWDAEHSCSGCSSSSQCHPGQSCYGNPICWGHNHKPEFGSSCAYSCQNHIHIERSKQDRCHEQYD